MKPKQQYADQPTKDRCQTPPYALEPLDRHINNEFFGWNNLRIWEPACGEGYLVNALANREAVVHESDILYGEDFFKYEPAEEWDIIITNPPYSIKYPWIERCYELGKPWALLMPLETLGAARAQKLFKQYGMELIVLDKRVDFKIPEVGWGGSGAQFPVAWFTYGLNIGKEITYATIDGKDKKEWKEKEVKL